MSLLILSSGGAVASGGGGGGEGPAVGELFSTRWSTELGGFDTYVGDESEGTDYARSLVTNGGPGGAVNAARLALIVGGAAEDNWGWRVTIANQTNGVPRYFAFYVKPAATNNYVAADSGRVINKTLILGDSGTGARMILNVQGILNGGPQISCIFDGLDPPLDTNEVTSPYTDGEWISIQMEVTFGSGSAGIKIWINNDTYASPDLETSSGSFTNTASGEISLGSYHNDSITTGGVFTHDYSHFDVSASFDNTRYSSLQSLLGA